MPLTGDLPPIPCSLTVLTNSRQGTLSPAAWIVVELMRNRKPGKADTSIRIRMIGRRGTSPQGIFGAKPVVGWFGASCCTLVNYGSSFTKSRYFTRSLIIMAKQWRLKKLINWNIQGPIVIRLIVHFLAYNAATLFLLLVVYSVQGSLAAVAEQPVSAAPMTFWQQATPILICMLVMMPFMIWDLIKLTNHIAGPLFRFGTILNDFGKTGKLRTAALRDGDLLTDFQQRFNDFATALHAQYPETQPASVAPVAEPVRATVAFRKSV